MAEPAESPTGLACATVSDHSASIAICPSVHSGTRVAGVTEVPDAHNDGAACLNEANSAPSPVVRHKRGSLTMSFDDFPDDVAESFSDKASSRRPSMNKLRSSIRRTSRIVSQTYHAEDDEAPFFAKFVYACDPYGVAPVTTPPLEEQARAHVCGCCANFARVGLMLCTMAYTISIMLEYEYDVVQGIIQADINLNASITSLVKPPQIGVYCCTTDRTIDLAGQDRCNSTGFIDVKFAQRGFKEQLRLPKRDLGFYHCAGDFVRYDNRPNFQDLEGKYVKCPLDKNYTLVGDFQMPIYAYIQADLHSCPWEAGATVRPGSGCRTGEIVEKWVKKCKCVFAEEYMKAELTEFVEGKVKYMNPIPIVPEQRSFRFHYVHQAQQKVEVYHNFRYINVESWVLDSDQLRNSIMDIRFKELIPAYKYVDSSSWNDEAFLKFYVRMDTQALLAYLKPQSRVLEMISSWGAYWALFSAVFAGIVMVVNWRFYAHVAKPRKHLDRSASYGGSQEFGSQQL